MPMPTSDVLTLEELELCELLFPEGRTGVTNGSFADVRRLLEKYIRAALTAAASRYALDLKRED